MSAARPLMTPLFAELLVRRLPAAAITALRSPGRPDALFAAYAAAARTAGRRPLNLDDAERGRILAAGVDWPLCHRTDELFRIALVVSHVEAEAGRGGGGASVRDLEELFRAGDNEERQALLRALALLPDPGPWVPLAVEACRTNVRDVFEALACENPFPARSFPEPSFNQMVLKALFLEVRLERVLGLAGRVTPELLRMARDYASERRAAGRSVPADIAWLERLAGAEEIQS